VHETKHRCNGPLLALCNNHLQHLQLKLNESRHQSKMITGCPGCTSTWAPFTSPARSLGHRQMFVHSSCLAAAQAGHTIPTQWSNYVTVVGQRQGGTTRDLP
jgi:hypothetical protein